ncbi:PEP-CTERM sorting domain-containing protein [Paraglaciecola aquimarina]|uniref:PEP-CTERM sorting domain-containing protein n=1 Tax=Paraglaciecola algarum TaxID=3050085 RepID=A0ABS9D5I8_9ALTE|nr:PEP-CTERM sorting domain-containing protein [Paraglaciecola sp. G1-23]MCF2948040.1 PEP-CTERM sorting domain-containing protein [Paraglaciecola sp. G1-23]
MSKWLMVFSIILPLGAANAIVIPAGVSIEGTVSFDDSSSFVFDAVQDDSMGIGTSISSITGGSAAPTNSISQQLTDPLFINSNLSASNVDVDFDFVSYFFSVDLVNNLANEVEFFFSFELEQTASVNGDDAGILSEINLTDDFGDAIFSSEFELYSDDSQVNSEFVNFSFLLGAGESLTFDGLVDLTVFNYDTSNFSLLTEASLSLTSLVQNSTDVSAPGTLSVLLSVGLMGLGFRRRKHIIAV